MKIKIVNHRKGDEDKINLLLTYTSETGLKGIKGRTSVKLSDFIKDNPSMIITADSMVGARLYAGYDTFVKDPVPGGTQYYGWIEFTQKVGKDILWANLSNVDLTGLPLALSGTDSQSKAFSVGYKKSVTDIIADMKKDALSNDAPYITCASGQIKVVGPNKLPDSYPSYESYINELSTNNAPLTITSDTPKNGSPITLKGSFLDAKEDSDPIISLQTDDGKYTLEVLKSQFNSKICYQCDGGTLQFNGKTVNQNQSPQDTNDKLYANSSFRNILIGINEGYFTKAGPNNSQGFAGLVPFKTHEGNKYAQVLHENSNSYGFPYADSNLKVLIQADANKEVTMTICTDTEAFGYSDDNDGSNQPASGTYNLGIGDNSGDNLGIISIGNWRYLPNPTGGYGGYLPDMPDWTKMHFSKPDKYIWVKNGGQFAVGDGFNPSPIYIENTKTITWGADVSWVNGAASPAKPTDQQPIN